MPPGGRHIPVFHRRPGDKIVGRLRAVLKGLLWQRQVIQHRTPRLRAALTLTGLASLSFYRLLSLRCFLAIQTFWDLDRLLTPWIYSKRWFNRFNGRRPGFCTR